MNEEREITERLAIIYPKAIGDFIFVLPTLHTIRRAMPETHITLVVKKKQAPLAEPQKGALVDEVLVLGGDTNWLAVRRRLTAGGVDTIVDLAGNDQSGLILAWRGERRIRPHRSDCKGMCALYSPFAGSMPRLEPGLHRVHELLSFARYLGATEPVLSFRMELPEQAIAESEKMIERHNLRSGSVIALNIGASRKSKRWPAEHIRTLTVALLARDLRVVLMGAAEFKSDGHHDRTTVAQFHETGLIDGERCVELITDAGLTPALHLQRDTHFLRYSNVPRVVVGDDTGMLHIAGSVGDDTKRKTVSLFGPTNWGRYAPYDPSRHFPDKPAGEWNRVLCADVECKPTGVTEACHNYRSGCAGTCMNKLLPETVLEAILSAVNEA